MPVERTHGEIVVGTLSDSELLFQIFKRIELVAGVELLVVLHVAVFNLSVVLGREGTNLLMTDSQIFQRLFKKR